MPKLEPVLRYKERLGIATGSAAAVQGFGIDHEAVALSAAAQELLSLLGQQLDLPDQAANTVLAAPDGSSGAPDFRALTANDWTGIAQMQLGADTSPGATTCTLEGLPAGPALNLGWFIFDPYTTECEIRKWTGGTATAPTFSALTYGHNDGDPVLWVTESIANIKWFGAKGDGSTDDTTPIQRALDAVRIIGGGVVVVPHGTHKTTATLTVGDRTRITGGGIIQLYANSSTDGLRNHDQVSGNSQIVLDRVTIIGPEDGTMTDSNGSDTARGIYFKTCTDCIIAKCKVSRFWLQGIQVDASARVRITDNSVTEIKAGNGISVDDAAADIVIANNNTKDTADCGIGLHNASAQVVISANTVNNTNFGQGIDIYGVPDVAVLTNYIGDVGGVGVSGNGILLHPGLSGFPHRASIVGNVIKDTAANGIMVWGDSATATNDIVIANNVIYVPDEDGIRIARNVTRGVITGNHIYGAGEDGIEIEEGGGYTPTDFVVSGNHARGCTGYGLVVSANVTGVTGAGNSLLGNTAGPANLPTSGNTILYESASDYMIVTGGLTVKDLYATAGFYLQGGDLNITNVGSGIRLKEGGGAPVMGIVTLSSGSATVTTTAAEANSRIVLSRSSVGGTPGYLSYTINAGVSFTINSSSGSDTSTVAWVIFRQA